MIDAIRSEDPIRSKIEALGTTLSLPTVRKALGILEGAHASDKRFGADDVMDIRIYEPGDEAKRIDWKTSARVGRPMVVQRERPSTSRAWLLLDVGQEMTGTCVSGEQVHQVDADLVCGLAAVRVQGCQKPQLLVPVKQPHRGVGVSYINGQQHKPLSFFLLILIVFYGITPCRRMQGRDRGKIFR